MAKALRCQLPSSMSASTATDVWGTTTDGGAAVMLDGSREEEVEARWCREAGEGMRREGEVARRGEGRPSALIAAQARTLTPTVPTWTLATAQRFEGAPLLSS